MREITDAMPDPQSATVISNAFSVCRADLDWRSRRRVLCGIVEESGGQPQSTSGRGRSRMDDPEQERRSMTRESARRPRKSRKRKAPFQRAELLSNPKQVAGELAQHAVQRAAMPDQANHTLRYGTTAEIEGGKPADDALRPTEFNARMIVD